MNNKYNCKHTKKSIGIIIFDKSLTKVLLVEKKCTYAFSDFVMGKYDRNNKVEMVDKFNKMTSQEKIIISSLEFEWMWYNMFMMKDKSDFYCRSFGRFYKCFLTNPKWIKTLMSQSNKSSLLLWEPPKGRKGKTESSLTCAIREVQEETKIKPDLYQIIPNKKVKKQIISNNVRYIIIYYVAIMKENFTVRVNISDRNQSSEISEISWIKVTNLNNYNINNEIKQYIISTQIDLSKNRKKYKNIKEIID